MKAAAGGSRVASPLAAVCARSSARPGFWGKLSIWSAGIVLALAGGCQLGSWDSPGWRTVFGSGKVVTESRTVHGFHQVAISGSGQLIIESGDAESLAITGDDNLLPLIRSEVQGGKLEIGPRQVALRPSQSIRYHLFIRQLDVLSISGAVHVQAGELRGQRLTLDLSGSSHVEIGRLDVDALEVGISGSGRIQAAGKARQQTVRISGSGDYLAGGLQSDRAAITVSGSAHATLWADRELSARISGSGQVRYRGRPAIESHVSGSGRLDPADTVER